jgi:hypothetical protein
MMSAAKKYWYVMIELTVLQAPDHGQSPVCCGKERQDAFFEQHLGAGAPDIAQSRAAARASSSAVIGGTAQV